MRACASKADLECAQKSYIHLLNNAVTGLLLGELYDEKKCHEAFRFRHRASNDDIKILRIWGTGAIRMYFLYLPDKNIVLLKTMAKRVQKLSVGEIKQIQDIAVEVLDCLTENEFSLRIVCKPDLK